MPKSVKKFSFGEFCIVKEVQMTLKHWKSNYYFMLLKKVYTLKSDFVIKSCFIYLPTFVIRAFLHLTTCNYFLKNALFVFYFNISIKDIKVQNWKKNSTIYFMKGLQWLLKRLSIKTAKWILITVVDYQIKAVGRRQS